MVFKLDEDKFMAAASEPGSDRRKAKWHAERAGTGMPASLEKSGQYRYKAELKERGVSSEKKARTGSGKIDGSGPQDSRGKEHRTDSGGWPSGTEKWAFR